MSRKKVEFSLLDTNVLLDATDTRRPRHQAVVELLERQPGLVFSAQVAREYLVVATRNLDLNGVGLELVDALANLTEFRRSLARAPSVLFRPLRARTRRKAAGC